MRDDARLLSLKIALSAMGLAAQHLRGRRRPFIINHLVTVRCNLACPFCYVSGPEQREFNQLHYGKRTEMSTEEMRQLYRQLVARNFKIAVVLGGEPLLRADLGEILRELRGHLYVTLFTNGYLLAERVEMVESVTNLFVSLDAPDREHDQLRAQPGVFERAMAGIDRVRRRFPSIRVALNMTVTEKNARRVPEMIRFARELALPVGFQPPSHSGQFTVGDRPHRESEALLPAQAAVADAFRAVRDASDRGERIIGSRAFFSLVIDGVRRYPCTYPAYVLGPVLPNGDVVGCTESRVIGNVRSPGLDAVLDGGALADNAGRGQSCPHGCRDWGIHDLSAVSDGRFDLNDARHYYSAFVSNPRLPVTRDAPR
ncbi:MAG: radical SAM protein [Deltaproteobacteria bacterium]|nr:radical SAM protein [Deltaproteobacteria bacterium]